MVRKIQNTSATGEALTARVKSERRVAYEFNFHVPKSVSRLDAITGDERIANAFRCAVEEMIAEMEAEMKARVRRAGKTRGGILEIACKEKWARGH
ncbi:MAG TPA: relaxase domain-containing protein [Tepidisphaeraceae bacterium]|jgi:hypothetical protein|nr:relaxase domain-containing protein [Tepidisphaeraceae bacterium]